MTRDAERAYMIGYRLARHRAQRELAQMRESRDELRAALAELRGAVEDRRQAEAAIVNFWRDIVQEHESVALH